MARVPWRPPAFKNAKSMRYNSGTLPLPKHARRLPGTMQTANMAKQVSTAPGQVIAHTFGLFRKSSGCARLQQRGNNRVPMPGTLRLAVAPVPIDETDALKLGVGLDLLVNPADVGSPGAFEGACPCLCARRFAPAGSRLLAYLRPRARRPVPAPAPAGSRPCHPPVPTFSISRKFVPRARVRPYSSGLRRGDKGICASEMP